MKFLLLAALLCCGAAAAQERFDGYLCCNLRSDGKWISDINYAESGKQIIPLGTPVKVTGYGKQRVLVEINGSAQAIGNDYSRDLSLEAFARRYVVRDNPMTKVAALPDRIQRAITSARVTRGMTREQVIMALGYPVTSENPHLDARDWRYWLWTFDEFRVVFDADGRVGAIEADADLRRRVVLD